MDTFEDLQSKILLTTTTDKNVSLTLDGLNINYDLDTIPKNFAMGSGGVSWTDGTLNFNTGLGRLASIQEAFQAVQLPPNAFTLKLNDSLLLTDGITDSAVHSKTQSLITDGIETSTLTKSSLVLNQGNTTSTLTDTSLTISNPIAGNQKTSVIADATIGTSENYTPAVSFTTANKSFNVSTASLQVATQLIVNDTGSQYQSLGQIVQKGDMDNAPYDTQPSLKLYEFRSGLPNSGTKELEMTTSGIQNSSGDFVITTPLNLSLSCGSILSLGSTNLTSSSNNLTLLSSSAGGALNPQLTLTNTNATGSVALEIYKNKPTAGVAGDVLYNQSVFGKDNGNLKQEFTRISHTLRNSSIGGEDGSIEFSAFVDGAVNTFLQINGNENEVNCLKTLDMGSGANIRSSTGNIVLTTATSSGIGNVDVIAKGNVNIISNGAGGFIDLTAVSSVSLTATGDNLVLRGGTLAQLEGTGTGADVVIKPETTAGDLVLEGTNIESASRGSNSGQNLRIKLNGTYYKIQLYDDT
jgi:hypothetical protein